MKLETTLGEVGWWFLTHEYHPLVRGMGFSKSAWSGVSCRLWRARCSRLMMPQIWLSLSKTIHPQSWSL